MKKYFFTGLFLAFPLLFTIWVVKFLLELLTTPLLAGGTLIMSAISDGNPNLSFLHSKELLLWLSRGVSLALLFALLTFVGILGNWIFFHSILKAAEKVLNKIPLAGTIYQSVKDLTGTFVGRAAIKLDEPVLIPFPNKKAKSIAFVTKKEIDFGEGLIYTAIFMPSPPNPLLGLLLFVPKEKIEKVEMPIGETMQFVATCGILLKSKSQDEK